MRAQPLTQYYPVTSTDLTAEMLTVTPWQKMKYMLKRFVKRSDTLAMRVALPPMAVWAVLYSLVEFMI